MHTFGETGAGVPAFLAKLWRLVEDPETNHLIYWSRDGRSFIIQNQAQFARELLPLNYKHNNMASFIRQLNMYGFHKITSIDNGGLKFDRDEMEFSHPFFKRGCPYLLEHIKRKIANTKTTTDDRSALKPETVNKVLTEVKVMRGRQDSLDSRFSVMKQENEALWREIASLRQKHMKQQQIVNKLIQFLVTMVQPSRNMTGVKRSFQLMINDVPRSSKVRKCSEGERGPVISELTEELLDEVVDSDTEIPVDSPNVLSPADAANQMDSELNEEGSPHSEKSTTPEHHLSNPNEISQFDSNQDDEILPENIVSNTNTSGNSHQSEIVFHINNEMAQPDSMDSTTFLEENVLNTSMVKEEIARNQAKLKQQQQQQQQQQKNISQVKRRNLDSNPIDASTENPAQIAGGSLATSLNNSDLLQQQQQQNVTLNNFNDALKIKIENDVDALMFLDVSGTSNNSGGSHIISPNSNSNASQSEKQMYASGEFLNTDMPTDLFEESPMLNDVNLATGSYNENINLKQTGKNVGTNHIGISVDDENRNGSPLLGGNIPVNENTISGDNEAQTSTPIGNSLTIDGKDNNKSSLTLAKYPIDEDIMRLSTAQEFTSHIDTVQEDLENLRDILRGEGYSVDTNTLMGKTSTNRMFPPSPLDGDIFLAKLFSDSEILAPYGLSFTANDPINDGGKRGTELVSYQPYATADFSDILDIPDSDANLKALECDDKSTKSPTQSNSVLNTPYRERE